MLDDAHDDGHGQQHRRGYPEPVEQHEQRQIQRADEQQVQHEHEVALGCIFDTKPQPTTGLDSCTRVPDWLTPHCSAATAAMSNTTNRTPYSQPGNGLYSRRPPFLPPLPPFLPEEEFTA